MLGGPDTCPTLPTPFYLKTNRLYFGTFLTQILVLATRMPFSDMLPSTSASGEGEAAESDRVGTRNCHEIFSSQNLSRSIFAQDDSIMQHKIEACSRNSSFVIAGFQAVHDLEDYGFCDLNECTSTVRIFPQDDCLHTRIPPFRFEYGPSRLGRARYNFQQGLLNMREVMEKKDSRPCQAAPIKQDWAPDSSVAFESCPFCGF